jgi:hypothetical protein
MSVTVLILACYIGVSILLLGLVAKVLEWRNRRRWQRRRDRRGGNILDARFGDAPAGQTRISARERKW